jgi:hypothetical protein
VIVSGGHSAWAGFAALVMGSLSVYGLLSLLFFAGIAGTLFSSESPLPRVALALVIGVAAALACGAMMERLMGDTSGQVTHENTRLEGREVRIAREIRPAGTGEVIFSLNGGVYQNIPARSLDGAAIQAGQLVVVVEVRRGIALVEPLGHAIDDSSDAASDTTYASDALDVAGPNGGEEPPSSPLPASP